MMIARIDGNVVEKVEWKDFSEKAKDFSEEAEEEFFRFLLNFLTGWCKRSPGPAFLNFLEGACEAILSECLSYRSIFHFLLGWSRRDPVLGPVFWEGVWEGVICFLSDD
jgi:hypothetical protein